MKKIKEILMTTITKKVTIIVLRFSFALRVAAYMVFTILLLTIAWKVATPISCIDTANLPWNKLMRKGSISVTPTIHESTFKPVFPNNVF
jgi:hypothetical protein